jgi:hypothetical protein
MTRGACAGDFHPTTQGSRLFTFFYLLLGLGLFTFVVVCQLRKGWGGGRSVWGRDGGQGGT